MTLLRSRWRQILQSCPRQIRRHVVIYTAKNVSRAGPLSSEDELRCICCVVLICCASRHALIRLSERRIHSTTAAKCALHSYVFGQQLRPRDTCNNRIVVAQTTVYNYTWTVNSLRSLRSLSITSSQLQTQSHAFRLLSVLQLLGQAFTEDVFIFSLLVYIAH